MQPQHRRQIDLREHVAVEHDDRFFQRIPGVADRARRPERDRLDDVPQPEAEPLAFAEHFLDPPRLVIEAQDRFVDLRHLLEQIDLIVEKRPVENRHDRLRRVHGQGPEPRPFPTGQQNRFHDKR